VRDADQVAALEAAMGGNLTIVSGGPGTGKTSLMVNLLRCFVRCGIPAGEILLGAPTGRAAQRMTEALQTHLSSIRRPASADKALLGLKGGTLHRILRYDPARHRFRFGPGRPLAAKVVILDEVSMVDVVMMDHLLQAIDPLATRLVLLGDKDQLPSVEAGAVLAGLIPPAERESAVANRMVMLKKAYRAGGRLIRLADAVKSGILALDHTMPFSDALDMAQDQWAFVEAEEDRNWRRHLIEWATRRYLAPVGPETESYLQTVERAAHLSSRDLTDTATGQMLLGRLFQAAEEARILCLTRRGVRGSRWINQLIAALFGRTLGQVADLRARTVPGELIMILRNDYAKGLFNGDLGIALHDRQGTERVFFRKSDGCIEFAAAQLPPWESAFAMTVHKSQGSEYGEVLLVLPETPDHRLLTREMIYTAVTRARKRVILYGSGKALTAGVEKRIQRETGMLWKADENRSTVQIP
jgi:exodeoxyribonuclease V alpha subunit